MQGLTDQQEQNAESDRKGLRQGGFGCKQQQTFLKVMGTIKTLLSPLKRMLSNL